MIGGMLPPALSGLSANAVASLSRAFASEIENLPTRYIREFYKIKVKDDIEALPSPKSPGFKARFKRVSRELRKLEAANNGSSAAYEHILSLAYGRKGKLRRELMEPLFSDPSAPLPPPIIPPLESSRPPVYSPEMTALMTSNFSVPTPRTEKQLRHPPLLPPRADPGSSDARILGPLSKRREVNLRWRFFKKETAKVQPPIEVSRIHVVQASKSHDKSAETSTTEGPEAGDMERPTPPSVGFQGTSVLRDLEAIAFPNPNIPKRARDPPLQGATNTALPISTVNRFIRRQHRKLLGKVPILTYFKHPNSPIGKYEVSLSPLVYSDSLAMLTSTVPMADEADLAWLRLPPPPQEPKVTVKPMPKPDRIPRADEELKHESTRVDSADPPDELQRCPTSEPQVDLKLRTEERTKLKVESDVDYSPQFFLKLEYTVCPSLSRSSSASKPPNQRDHPLEEDSKRLGYSNEMTGERLQGVFPRPPPPNGILLFKGNLVKNRGSGKP